MPPLIVISLHEYRFHGAIRPHTDLGFDLSMNVTGKSPFFLFAVMVVNWKKMGKVGDLKVKLNICTTDLFTS